jgi:ESS family glutamate:Na+ symporter
MCDTLSLHDALPISVAGGMVYALAALLLRDRVVNFQADTALRDLLMTAFMTTVGLSARFDLVRRGGPRMAALLAVATAGAVAQNLLGMGLAALLGVDPRLGILAGSVALAGGPGTALAFGPTFEKMGVAGATTVAFASATFGITVAGFLAADLGARLIRRRGLRPAPEARRPAFLAGAEPRNLISAVLAIGIALGLGSALSGAIERTGIVLPGYIGAMMVAALLRNLDDRFGWFRISQEEVEVLGRAALYLFIVMALVTLRLWELAHLALPLLVILAAQVPLCWLLSTVASFRAMGRDYDAAVGAAGFCGFMLGVTANAVASMEELAERFGPAPRAFLTIPVVGAFLIDFTNALVITAMANLLR